MRKQKNTIVAVPVVPPTVNEMIDSEITILSRYCVGARQQEEIVRDVRKVADRLRSLAEEIERRALRAEVEVGLVPVPDGHPRAGEYLNDPAALDRIAAETQHDVLWGVANLSLDRLAASVQEYAAQRAELDAHVLHRVVPQIERFARALGAGAFVAATCDCGNSMAIETDRHGNATPDRRCRYAVTFGGAKEVL